MPIVSALRVVSSSGAIVFDVDDRGIRDGTNRVFQAAESISSRLFATPLAAYMWTCMEGVWQIVSANAKFSVTGGAACTVDVLVSAGVVAPAGTTQLTAPIDIEETAPFSRNGVIIASPTLIFPGDSVSRVIAGTPGSLEGLLTIQLKRVQ